MYQVIKPDAIPSSRSCKMNPQIKADLQDFMATSALAAEIRIPDGQLPKYAYAAYHNAVTRLGYPIQVMVRGGKLFMRKKTALGAGTPAGGKGK